MLITSSNSNTQRKGTLLTMCSQLKGSVLQDAIALVAMTGRRNFGDQVCNLCLLFGELNNAVP